MLRRYSSPKRRYDNGAHALLFATRCVANSYAQKVPKQPNLIDCGVYLIQYARIFLTNPAASEDAIKVRVFVLT